MVRHDDRTSTLNLDSTAVIAVAAALLVVPGGCLALTGGLRGWAAAAAAPILTAAQVLVGVLVCSTTGSGWSLGSAAVIWLVSVAVVAGFRLTMTAVRRRRRPDAVPPPTPWSSRFSVRSWVGWSRSDGPWSVLAAISLLVAGAAGARVVAHGTGGLTEPNQGFDAPFHVNMVETILATGKVRPSIAGSLNGYPAGTDVYPDGMHALAALVAQVHGGSITAINGLLACVPFVAALGLVGLLRSFGLRREAVVVPVLLAATSGYPFDLIWRGPIWIYAFGIALVPSFLVLLRQSLTRRSSGRAAALGLGAGGLALVHPSAALSAGVFAACLLLQRWVAHRGALRRDLVVLVPSVALAGVLVWPLVGPAIVSNGGGTVVDWPAVQSPGDAIGGLLLYNYQNAHPQVFLAAAALVGVLTVHRRPSLRWWALATGVFTFLCVLAASYDGPVVQLLTGPWWNDRFRFEGLVFMGLTVLGAVGVVQVAGWITRAVLAVRPGRAHLRAARDPMRHLVPSGALVVLLLLLAWGTSGLYSTVNVARLQLAYSPLSGGSITPGDEAAYRVLKGITGPGPVLNDPNDGSAWMWSLAGVKPVFGAALTVPVVPPLAPDRQILVDGLNCFDSSPQVRQAVRSLGVRYVFVANSTILVGPTPTRGFHDLSAVSSLEPVYQHDGVTVYRIDFDTPVAAAPGPACQLSAAAD